MVVQQGLVHLEVEKLASIGYANNKLKEAIKHGFFFSILFFFFEQKMCDLPKGREHTYI